MIPKRVSQIIVKFTAIIVIIERFPPAISSKGRAVLGTRPKEDILLLNC